MNVLANKQLVAFNPQINVGTILNIKAFPEKYLTRYTCEEDGTPWNFLITGLHDKIFVNTGIVSEVFPRLKNIPVGKECPRTGYHNVHLTTQQLKDFFQIIIYKARYHQAKTFFLKKVAEKLP